MQFGAQVNCYRTTWDNIALVVNTMEKGRWDSLWFADHYLPPPGRREDEGLPAHECFTLISAAAILTTRMRLGPLVLGNPYRTPALVAKMATPVDQISHGRFTLSIGAAWFKREHEAFGWKFPEMRERSDRLEEACQVLRMLLGADGPVDFNGQYYNLDQAQLAPGCYKERIPIMVGGTGEVRTLKTLAMYGDIFNLDGWARGPMTLDYYHHKLSVLERHCERVGRDPSEIRHTILMPVMLTDDKDKAGNFIAARGLGEGTVAGPRQYCIDRIGEFKQAGVDEIMFGGMITEKIEQYQRFDDEVLSAFY